MEYTTKTRELVKIMNALEALGYQVDSIKMQPETGFDLDLGRCLVKITVSPLIKISCEENPSKSLE